MALPSTGPISMSQVRTELGRTGTISLNDGTVRALAGKASGTISMADLRGKSAILMLTVTPGAGGNFRGWAHGGYGSISSRSYGGFTLSSVTSGSATPNAVTIGLTGSVAPGWTKVHINGVAYTCVFTSDAKLKLALGSAAVTNAYTIFTSTFTIGFS